MTDRRLNYTNQRGPDDRFNEEEIGRLIMIGLREGLSMNTRDNPDRSTYAWEAISRESPTAERFSVAIAGRLVTGYLDRWPEVKTIEDVGREAFRTEDDDASARNEIQRIQELARELQTANRDLGLVRDELAKVKKSRHAELYGIACVLGCKAVTQYLSADDLITTITTKGREMRIDLGAARWLKVTAGSSKVDGPAHYDGTECMEWIERLGLGFRLGNVFKYVWRSGRKGARIKDLRKALWYLQREIDKAEEEDRPIQADRSGEEPE